MRPNVYVCQFPGKGGSNGGEKPVAKSTFHLISRSGRHSGTVVLNSVLCAVPRFAFAQVLSFLRGRRAEASRKRIGLSKWLCQLGADVVARVAAPRLAGTAEG